MATRQKPNGRKVVRLEPFTVYLIFLFKLIEQNSTTEVEHQLLPLAGCRAKRHSIFMSENQVFVTPQQIGASGALPSVIDRGRRYRLVNISSPQATLPGWFRKEVDWGSSSRPVAEMSGGRLTFEDNIQGLMLKNIRARDTAKPRKE